MIMITGLILASLAGIEFGDKAGREELKQMRLTNARLEDMNHKIEQMIK